MEKTQIIKEEPQQDNTIKLLTHVLGLITGFLGPLILLLTTQDEEVKNHAKKALNWQISLAIYIVISLILMFVLIGFLLIFIVLALDVIFCIIAAVKANNGELWNYPLAIPFLK